MVSYIIALHALVLGDSGIQGPLERAAFPKSDLAFASYVPLASAQSKPRNSRDRGGGNDVARPEPDSARNPCLRYRKYVGRRREWVFDRGEYRRPRFRDEPDAC